MHPFADYNGRAARLFAVAVLTREGTLTRSLFCPERYYAEDREAYYQALRAVKRTHNLNDWLEYYVAGLASEMARVGTKVAELNQLTDRLVRTVQLNRNQEKIVAALTAGDRAAVSRPEVEAITGLNRSRAFEELATLVAAGVLRQRGQSVRTTYVLDSTMTRPARPPRGAHS